MEKKLTFGQIAVGLTFNPSGDPEVIKVKQHYADIIDMMNDLRNSTSSGELRRHCSVAITDAETAQMRAVKAITWSDDIIVAEKAAKGLKPIDFQVDVVERSKTVPVLLDFFTVRCHPCQTLMPHLEELAAKQEFDLVKANCDTEHVLATQFQVMSVPRLVLYHKGEVVWDSKDHKLNNSGRVEAVAAKIDEIRGIKKAE